MRRRSEVERRLRQQERRWPAAKYESRAAFIRRVRRTALGLPRTFINKSVGDLSRRVQLLHEAKGGLFEEGGRRRTARRPL